MDDSIFGDSDDSHDTLGVESTDSHSWLPWDHPGDSGTPSETLSEAPSETQDVEAFEGDTESSEAVSEPVSDAVSEALSTIDEEEAGEASDVQLESDSGSQASGPGATRTRSELSARRAFQDEREPPSGAEMTQPSQERAEAEGPPPKVRRLGSPAGGAGEEGEEGDGEACPICLEPWGNGGEHRLVALRCGHLFGSKCVERWIRGKPTKERSCPTCKARASLRDVRPIYARRLVASDTAELAALRARLETVQAERNLMQLELQTTRLEHSAALLQLELLRKGAAGAPRAAPRAWRFALDRNLEVCRDRGCRVLAFNCRTYEFYVSQSTTTGLFPGYGLRSVGGADYKLGPFLPLHPKPIRDVAYSQPTDLLMSVGLDGAVRIVERGTATATVRCGVPLWSCAWDCARPNYLHAGGVGGAVMTYDVRNTGGAVHAASTPDMSPCVALVSTEFGLLSCQLNSAWVWGGAGGAAGGGGGEPRAVPVRGPFVSLCYEREARRAALWCRPAARDRAKLVVLQLGKDGAGEVTFETVQTIPGSSRCALMSRAAFVRSGDACWLAAHSESEGALQLHPAGGGGGPLALPAAEPALDVCAGSVAGGTVLAALSDTRLRMYKAYAVDTYA